MDLYLVPFEEAPDKDSECGHDLSRNSDCLIRESARQAAQCGIEVEEIRHVKGISGRQSAQIFARHLDSPTGVIKFTELGPEINLEQQLDDLKQASGPVMLIADRSFLKRLVGRLVADDPNIDLVAFHDYRIVHLHRSDQNWTVVAGGEEDRRRMTLKAWLADFFDSVFSVDGRFRLTLRTLLCEPGRLSSEWLTGNRMLFAPPLRLYIVCSTVFFATVLITFEIMEPEPLLSGYDVAAVGQDGLIAQIREGAYVARFADQVLDEMLRLSPYFIIVMVPFLGMALVLMFRNKPMLYLEHLVFAVHLMAFWFLIMALMSVFSMINQSEFIGEWLDHNPDWVDVANAIIFGVIALVYSIVAARHFYNESWVTASAKMTTVSIAYVLLVFSTIVTAAYVRVVADDRRDHAHQQYWEIVEAWREGAEIAEREIHGVISLYLQLDGFYYSMTHTRLHIAELLLVAGRYDEAYDKVSSILVVEPENAYALAVTTGASCKLDDRQQSLEYLERYHAVRASRQERDQPLDHGRHQPLIDRYLDCAERLVET
jgi:hypothetical protein